MQTRIAALGHFLPDHHERAGVRRPIAVEPVGPSALAARAAHAAFEQSGLSKGDIDCIVFATMTPDVTFPGSACYLQSELGCETVPALDVRSQCTGFLVALNIADHFVRSGQYRCILVAGGEVHSSGLEYERYPQVARLFGDGAGVWICSPGDSGVRAVVLHADGRHHRKFWCEYPASRQHPVRMTREDFGLDRHFPVIDFEAVAAFAREHLGAVATEALEKSGWKWKEVDAVVFGHLFPEVAHDCARQLGLSPEQTLVPAESYGHLTAAALPVAVSEALASGRLRRPAKVLLAACGAGFAWGAAAVEL